MSISDALDSGTVGVSVDDPLALTVRMDRLSIRLLAEEAARIVVAQIDRRDYMTTEEIAEYLHWPVKRIDNLCAQRRIPFHKDGGRRVFVRQEIDQWVHQLPGPTVHEALLMAD